MTVLSRCEYFLYSIEKMPQQIGTSYPRNHVQIIQDLKQTLNVQKMILFARNCLNEIIQMYFILVPLVILETSDNYSFIISVNANNLIYWSNKTNFSMSLFRNRQPFPCVYWVTQSQEEIGEWETLWDDKPDTSFFEFSQTSTSVSIAFYSSPLNFLRF